MKALLVPAYRRLLLAGLLLRLALMPFTMHSDVLDQYWRAHFVSHHGVVNLPRYMLERYGFHAGPVVLPDLAHGVYLALARPLLPDIHRLFTDGPEAMVVLTDLARHRQAIHHFLSAGAAARGALLLFKLPYLVLDYAALALLLRLVADEAARRRLVAFWMLNFVSLFTLYMWGRYEILTSMFCIAALLALRAGRADRAALALGVAAATKYYPVLLLPGWTAAAAGDGRGRWRFALLFLLVPAAVAAAGLALAPPGTGTRLAATYHFDNVLRIGFDVGDAFWKEPFPLYPFVVGWSLLALADLHRAGPRGAGAASASSIAGLMLFYALSAFSPQYLFWCVPFVALAVARSPALARTFALLVAFFALSLLEFGSDFVNLFAPLRPGLVDEPLQPRYAPALSGTYTVALGVARSVFAALCGWLGWQVWRDAGLRQDG